MFILCRQFQIAFPSDCTHLDTHQQCVNTSPSSPTLGIVRIFNFHHSVMYVMTAGVVFICIPPITNHVIGEEIFFFFFEREFRSCYPGRSVMAQSLAHRNLRLLGSGNSPASASQSTGITGVSHHTQPDIIHNIHTHIIHIHI